MLEKGTCIIKIQLNNKKLDFIEGLVVNAGNKAIQVKNIRNVVCEVMEGGIIT